MGVRLTNKEKEICDIATELRDLRLPETTDIPANIIEEKAKIIEEKVENIVLASFKDKKYEGILVSFRSRTYDSDGNEIENPTPEQKVNERYYLEIEGNQLFEFDLNRFIKECSGRNGSELYAYVYELVKRIESSVIQYQKENTYRNFSPTQGDNDFIQASQNAKIKVMDSEQTEKKDSIKDGCALAACEVIRVASSLHDKDVKEAKDGSEKIDQSFYQSCKSIASIAVNDINADILKDSRLLKDVINSFYGRIKNNPELVKDIKIFQYEFNEDGTLKEIDEYLKQEKNFIDAVNQKMFNDPEIKEDTINAWTKNIKEGTSYYISNYMIEKYKSGEIQDVFNKYDLNVIEECLSRAKEIKSVKNIQRAKRLSNREKLLNGNKAEYLRNLFPDDKDYNQFIDAIYKTDASENTIDDVFYDEKNDVEYSILDLYGEVINELKKDKKEIALIEEKEPDGEPIDEPVQDEESETEPIENQEEKDKKITNIINVFIDKRKNIIKNNGNTNIIDKSKKIDKSVRDDGRKETSEPVIGPGFQPEIPGDQIVDVKTVPDGDRKQTNVEPGDQTIEVKTEPTSSKKKEEEPYYEPIDDPNKSNNTEVVVEQPKGKNHEDETPGDEDIDNEPVVNDYSNKEDKKIEINNTYNIQNSYKINSDNSITNSGNTIDSNNEVKIDSTTTNNVINNENLVETIANDFSNFITQVKPNMSQEEQSKSIEIQESIVTEIVRQSRDSETYLSKIQDDEKRKQVYVALYKRITNEDLDKEAVDNAILLPPPSKENEKEDEINSKEAKEDDVIVLDSKDYENVKDNNQIKLDEWIEEKEKNDAKNAEKLNNSGYQMNFAEWQKVKQVQDEKAAKQKKQPVSYTQEDNVTIGDIVAENKKKEEELYSKDVSEVQMGIEELDIPDENLYQEVFDMKSEDKYFNFFSDSNNSQKADKIFQELCNEGLSNKEILKTYKERVDFEIEKEHYSSLSEDKKEEYRNEHPQFKEKYIAQLTGLVKTRNEKINKLRHLKDDVLPQVEDLNKETTENRIAMEEMGGKTHG